MRYIRHKGLNSYDEFSAMVFDEGIPSMDRIELLRRIAEVDAGTRSPDTVGEPDPDFPSFRVWRSVMFETDQGRRSMWLAYEVAATGGVTVLRASSRFIGTAQEIASARAQARDRQLNGVRT